MPTFAELVVSRKSWIDQELIPWCRQARLSDLRRAELEWTDIAGKVDPAKTLWFWAWSRFPDLVNADLSSIDEARHIQVTLIDGRVLAGYPDARQSRQGQLVVLGKDRDRPRAVVELGPLALDDIVAITRVTSPR